jgi:hypothetical protein
VVAVQQELNVHPHAAGIVAFSGSILALGTYSKAISSTKNYNNNIDNMNNSTRALNINIH